MCQASIFSQFLFLHLLSTPPTQPNPTPSLSILLSLSPLHCFCFSQWVAHRDPRSANREEDFPLLRYTVLADVGMLAPFYVN